MSLFRKSVFALAVAMGALSSAQAASPAVFDAATGRLTMPVLQIDQNLKFRNVVIQLVSPGRLQISDTSVAAGGEISFSSSGNVLRIPQLSFGSSVYPLVSLTGASFTLVSFGDVVVDAGSTSNATLDIRVTAQGTAVPLITINNMPRPANQAAFCNDPALQQTVMQNAGANQASWSMTSCSFSGSTGRMEGMLTITSPISATVPIIANFTYR